ncbi:hypothetical protein DEU56DRAFT_783434 [Suillus clintonianus]|uniref:uncharacterized protein n=1 Tax=Suillus clintonianus TaxID=1904413 RepID=UPI001B85E82A|nr:uncharacterized protein DEU56DRAFT_783434 [Suillus clintonianus]KAG2147992.1 hypothetical protein DEU56DRAFT_783434 [Suillus clintonianus]
MTRRAPRIHRLPQRLDYNLIPAPLDLSLPLATEKSPLPAIIVTPSSPAADAPEYYIAFLKPPPKPTFRDRISEYSPFQPQLPLKARSAIIISLILFILICHLLVHLAVRRPHFDFITSSDNIASFKANYHQAQTSFWDSLALDFKSFWSGPIAGDTRSFIIEDFSQPAHR